jgi:hypothetical protein
VRAESNGGALVKVESQIQAGLHCLAPLPRPPLHRATLLAPKGSAALLHLTDQGARQHAKKAAPGMSR